MDGYASDEDLFGEEGSQSCTLEDCTKTPLKVESAEMMRLRSMMTGIPPPPDKTNPSIDVNTILANWKDNQHLVWQSSCSEVTIQTKYGLYYNNGNEESEILRIRVAERLVGSETCSSLVRGENLTLSAKKRQRRNGWSRSPGSRLSYLARRRTTFSARSVTMNNNLAKARTISIIKDDNKRKTNIAQKEQRLKRALFQSPDKPEQSTPENRTKRIRLSVGSPPKQSLNSSTSSFRTDLSIRRSLNVDFDKFENLNLNQRTRQMWGAKMMQLMASSQTSKIT